MYGTENRDRYRTYQDATASLGSAEKPPFQTGASKTSSLTALPWPTQYRAYGDVTWAKQLFAPPKTVDAHYRPSSSTVGSVAAQAHHQQVNGVFGYTRAYPSATVRYLQAPYLAGEMTEGAGIDTRPPSSVATYSLASERQAQMLATGEHNLLERLAHNASWTNSRSLRSPPLTAAPEPYLTTTNKSFRPQTGPNAQQHRLRSFTTSSLVPARSLNSTPTALPAPALGGSSSLHETRFLGVRDSDGGRRLLDINTTGEPTTAAVAGSAAAAQYVPQYSQRLNFVPSQPASTSVTDAEWALYAPIDPSATPLPRQPWPADATTPTQFRKHVDPSIAPSC